MFLEKRYGLLATKFKDYGLFVLYFKITDYYRSSSHRLLLHKRVLKGHKIIKKKDTYLSRPREVSCQNAESPTPHGSSRQPRC